MKWWLELKIGLNHQTAIVFVQLIPIQHTNHYAAAQPDLPRFQGCSKSNS